MSLGVRRGFVDVAEGQIHYRTAGAGRIPLVMLHSSPGSSKMIEPLIAALGSSRVVYAPDALGNGDSSPPISVQPEIADYADATLRAIDALGLDRFDLYGTHTGARIGTCLALARPDRVRRLILDGFGLYAPAELDEILKVYAPVVTPDQIGSHVTWAWHFTRDPFLFFPWFKKEGANRIVRDLPSAAHLHEKFVEIMKAITTYHLSYRAAFRYSMREHVPKLEVPTMITFARNDMVRPYLDDAAALLPGCTKSETPGLGTSDAVAESVAVFARFLDRP